MSIDNQIIAIQNVHGYVDSNGTAWLNAEDVANGLGFVEVMKDRAATTGGNFPTAIRWRRINDYLREFGFSSEVARGSFIPENMVYLLAMKANNETARNFQWKLANEIIPSIRKTGMYRVGDKVPQTFLEALKLAVQKEEERLALEQKCLEEKARADEYQSTHELYEAVTKKGGWISAKTVTDVLNILGLGRTNFYRFLREQGVVTGKNQPMRCHIETGLMKARYDDYLKQYCVEFSFKGLKYIYAKLVQANKVPSDLTLETWIKYCADLETNHADSEE